MVECNLPKVNTRVRFPSSAPLSKIVAPDETIESTVKG